MLHLKKFLLIICKERKLAVEKEVFLLSFWISGWLYSVQLMLFKDSIMIKYDDQNSRSIIKYAVSLVCDTCK